MIDEPGRYDEIRGRIPIKALAILRIRGAVLVVTLLLERISDRVNLTTVALALILVVLASATFFGRNPALLSSFVAMLGFNFYSFHRFAHGILPSPRILWHGRRLRSQR
ncbi:MAG: DUF4118 domain-containing protein [Acidobacteria bacterium]|nr:DUF4118 domain-containing protein [Acidobacteriota bacterium]